MISNGTRLGPYAITGPLGAGGMGEVYRARDSRLERTVAIKVMPAALSADARFRERFEREARVISSLSHPHICTLFDVGSENGVDYLVMEFLEGESLAERLTRGPLSMDQVLRYGAEIAEALEAAHRAGVVHRDLKPGNVVLTRSGAKLLDFGLAKFKAAPSFAQSDADAATAAMSHQTPLTEEGTIVGTFQYMAPEQIEGSEADARTDLFALGVLLYEMTTGRRAFEAKTRASLIASILDRDPPPLTATQPLTPPAFERIVKLCLAKDPGDRWQSAHDVAAQLRWLASSSGETAGAIPAGSRRKRIGGATLLAAGVLAGALAAFLLTRDRPQRPDVSRFSISTTIPILLENGSLAISPDGRRVVYGGLDKETRGLYLRSLNSLAATPIAGSEDGYNPAFSPDGRWIAFYAKGALYKIPSEGGTRVKVTDRLGGGLGLSWHGDTIYAARGFAGGLWAVSANGGEPRLVAKVDPARQMRAVTWPNVLPDGKTLLATVWNVGSWDSASIVAFSLEDGKSKVVLQNGSYGRYSPSGHLLFMRGGHLMAVSFDARSLETRNDAVAVVRNVSYGSANGEAQYAISAAGNLVYATGGDSVSLSSLIWMDTSGRREPIVPTRRSYGSFSVAADGRTAAVTIESSTFDIWSLDIDRDSITRLSHGGDDNEAVIAQDGSRVYWTSSRFGSYNLFARTVNGSGEEERLTTSEIDQGDIALTPDHHAMVFAAGNNGDLWTMSLGEKTPRPLLVTPASEFAPAISPDGRWLAYSSDESGTLQVYITAFPDLTGKWQVSIDGGSDALWMPNGREIVYLNGRSIMIAPIEWSPRPRVGKPRMIAEGLYDDDFSVGPDGRLGLVLNEGRKTSDAFNLVQNFSEELRTRVK